MARCRAQNPANRPNLNALAPSGRAFSGALCTSNCHGQRHHRWRPRHEERYRAVMGMSDTPNPRYDQAKRSVQALGPADQLRLIAELVGRLSGELDRQPRRSLLELQGLGKGVWKAIDVDEYLRRERSSCNG